MSITYELITTTNQLERVLGLLRERRAIGVTIETTGIDPYLHKIRTLQLATSESAFVIDLIQTPELIRLL
ncbi:MAG: hypothetical protein AB1489_37075, partial [Acidobacteriota bacterium]